MSASQFEPIPMLNSKPAAGARSRCGVQPDPRGDQRGHRRAQGDPLHEGHPRGTRLRLLSAYGGDPAVARCALRRRRHPPRPAHPPGALCDLAVADDPAAVRRWRARRRLRHRHRDVRVRGAGGSCCSVSRRMLDVAVATDSTHYLPRHLADELGIHQVSLYVGWQGQPERELAMDGFDAFYERLARDPELPSTSQPSIGDFLDSLGAAARGRA